MKNQYGFTTRPNCRHYFIPITIKQALGNITELKQTLKTKKPGDYSKKNVKENYKHYNNKERMKIKNKILERCMMNSRYYKLKETCINWAEM